jgi:hypothetical protein
MHGHDTSRQVGRLHSCTVLRTYNVQLACLAIADPVAATNLKAAPHLLFSPFALLCLSLYATKSASVKPSCADTKLMDAVGARLPLQRRPALLAHLQYTTQQRYSNVGAAA